MKAVLADFMRMHDPDADFVLPIYVRLESEEERLAAAAEARQRAKGLSAGQSPVAGERPPAGR